MKKINFFFFSLLVVFCVYLTPAAAQSIDCVDGTGKKITINGAATCPFGLKPAQETAKPSGSASATNTTAASNQTPTQSLQCQDSSGKKTSISGATTCPFGLKPVQDPGKDQTKPPVANAPTAAATPLNTQATTQAPAVSLSPAEQAKKEQDRLAQEALAKKEKERLAQEAQAKKEADRLAAEAKKKKDQERLAEQAQAKKEADRLAAEAKAKQEADRIAKEAQTKQEQDKLAQDAQKKKELEKLTAEAAAKKEADRIAADAAAKKEADRLAAEAAAKKEADRLALEAQKQKELELAALAAAQANEAAKQKLAAEAVYAHRKALVIGNDSYRNVTQLLNAREDARAMADSLTKVGYKVTLSLDATEKQMKAALRTFKAQVEPGDEVAIFYAGHGVQIASSNYLLPIDINGDGEEEIKDDAIALQRILEDMTEKKAKFTLAMVDACRDNPFKKAGRSVGGSGRGLAPTTAATGQMIVFSAGNGQQALDRLGPNDKDRNGLFTRVFIKQMAQPGVTVDRIVRSVRNEVVTMAKSVGQEQVPAIYDQVVGDFYFQK